MTPEQKARVSIDKLLVAAGWHVWNVADAIAQLNVNLANFSAVALPGQLQAEQTRIVAEVGLHSSIIREAKVDANLLRVQKTLAKAFRA